MSIESSSSSMSASTVATEEEDIEEESAVTWVKSDQHLDQLLNGELSRNRGQNLVLYRFLLRDGRIPTLRDKHWSQLVSSLSQVDILKDLNCIDWIWVIKYLAKPSIYVFQTATRIRAVGSK